MGALSFDEAQHLGGYVPLTQNEFLRQTEKWHLMDRTIASKYHESGLIRPLNFATSSVEKPSEPCFSKRANPVIP